MGLKIFAIILILFIAEITFLSTKEPRVLKVTKKDIRYASIEFKGIKGCSLDKNGISEQLTASSASKFSTYDELHDLNTTFHQNGLSHTLIAKRARYQYNDLYLSGDVHYENNESMHIKSEELEYNTKTKIVQSASAFTLTSDKGVMHGDSFVYDMKNQALEGGKMQYNFEVNEK